MMRNDEPMTTFTDAEWRVLKRATRNRRHRRRMKAETPLEKGRRMVAWMIAVERDDRTDPVERTVEPVKVPA